MKRIAVILSVLFLASGVASGQSLVERLANKAKNAAENTIGNKLEGAITRGVDKTVDKAAKEITGKKGKKAAWTCPECGKEENTGNVCPECGAKKPVVKNEAQEETADWTCASCGKEGNTGKFCEDCGARRPVAKTEKAAGWTCTECGTEGNTGKFCNECGAKKPGAAAPEEKKAVEKKAPARQISASYAKTDFVPGDELFFDDTFENEKLGEFPLRWKLLDGYVEAAELEGRKVLAFTDNGLGEVTPLIKPEYAWLPDIFTVEFDLFIAPVKEEGFSELNIELGFYDAGEKNNFTSRVTLWYRESDGAGRISWNLGNLSGEKDLIVGVNNNPLIHGEWNHFAFSFNKRAFKGYINGYRIINTPSMPVPGWLSLVSGAKYDYSGISNVRIAKGAVPLYDRLMSDGKIVTYAITFETGKADLKPESMIEINRIAKLMKENPGLEFEVQGHCDATGSDKVNDPLSQARAEAIVAALVEQDIAEARLTPVGKGSHSPVASNSTEEGRAKNRRVEFVKK